MAADRCRMPRAAWVVADVGGELFTRPAKLPAALDQATILSDRDRESRAGTEGPAMSAALSDIEELARKQWGEPNRQYSTREELRFGQHGSKSVKLKERTWFDHEAGEGGGFAD